MPGRDPPGCGSPATRPGQGHLGRLMTHAVLPRLLPPRDEHLGDHLDRFGPVPYRGTTGALITDVQAAGLTGRGGAAFPAHRKLAAVAAARGRKVAIANGAESEPAS